MRVVVVPVVVAPGASGVPSDAIRHPWEVLTRLSASSELSWPLAPVSVIAEAFCPWIVIRPTANVGLWTDGR